MQSEEREAADRIPARIWPVLMTGIIAGGMFLAAWYGLQLWFAIVLLGGLFLILTEAGREIMRQRQVRQRFQDTVVYMEQMIYAFRETQKVLNALEDVLLLFPEGKMHRCLVWGIRLIERRTDKGRAEELALHRIELEYPCGKMTQMHRFFLDVERLGGDFSNALELILRDFRLWEERAEELQRMQKKYQRDVVLSILASILICGVCLYLLPQKGDIRAYPLTQITATAFLLADAGIFLCVQKYCRGDIFETFAEDPYAVKKYVRCQKYQEKHEQKQSFLLALGPFLAVIGFGCFQKWIPAGICGMLTVFLLFQHRMGYLLAKRTVRRELAIAFPQWLMQIGLLLQADNVQVSIAKSQVFAPAVLQPALRQMVMELEYAPEEQRPFLHFLQEFSITGVRSSMRMLYAVSSGIGNNPTEQIAAVIHRIQNEYDRILRQRNIDSMAGMYLLFLAPAVAGMLKLAIDMGVFMMIYFTGITV